MNENMPGKLVTEEKPSTEVVAKARRRTYTAEYKLRILREVEACRGSGEIGALLRREGLYSSNLTKWRRQREQGSLDGLVSQRRGPKEDEQAKRISKPKEEKKPLVIAKRTVETKKPSVKKPDISPSELIDDREKKSLKFWRSPWRRMAKGKSRNDCVCRTTGARGGCEASLSGAGCAAQQPVSGAK